jgi:hypothetical protein
MSLKGELPLISRGCRLVVDFCRLPQLGIDPEQGHSDIYEAINGSIVKN